MSNETEAATRQLDDEVNEILNKLHSSRMDRHTNVVIMSNHGMANGLGWPGNGGAGVKTVSVGPALKKMRRHVSKIVGSGAYAMVYLKNDKWAALN